MRSRFSVIGQPTGCRVSLRDLAESEQGTYQVLKEPTWDNVLHDQRTEQVLGQLLTTDEARFAPTDIAAALAQSRSPSQHHLLSAIRAALPKMTAALAATTSESLSVLKSKPSWQEPEVASFLT